MNTFLSYCENDTLDFAKKFASKLSVGDIIILSGDLGSGKTKFTQGFLEYFGIYNEISSPTFTIVNEYNTPKMPIYHFDIYRLSSPNEFYEIGGTDYFDDGICIIEWGEIIEKIIPADYIKITFNRDFSNNDLRTLNVEAYGERLQNIVKNIFDGRACD